MSATEKNEKQNEKCGGSGKIVKFRRFLAQVIIWIWLKKPLDTSFEMNQFEKWRLFCIQLRKMIQLDLKFRLDI